MDSMKNTKINNADIMTGDIVTLKDGRRGKTIVYIESGKYAIIGSKNKEPAYFHIDDVIKIVRKPLRQVRIYQIEPVESEYAFKNYENVKAKQRNAPPAKLYKVVFDGNLETNTLEDIFYIFNMKHPHGYKGRSLSVSDIVELYDSKGSRYFYCDTMGFRKIRFKPVKL